MDEINRQMVSVLNARVSPRKGEDRKKEKRGEQNRERESLYECRYHGDTGFLCWPSERQRGEKAKDKDRDRLCLVYHRSDKRAPTHTPV